jgi:hypothetical protein
MSITSVVLGIVDDKSPFDSLTLLGRGRATAASRENLPSTRHQTPGFFRVLHSYGYAEKLDEERVLGLRPHF